MIVIKYWPMKARGSGLFRMCIDHGKVKWKHEKNSANFDATLLDCNHNPDSTNLAPPIIVDTKAAIAISQAMPCHVYLGNKLGFNKGITIPELAMQYMGDVNDLMNEMCQAGARAIRIHNVTPLKDYLKSERYKRHLTVINNTIKGPYYFGDSPTYVDYFAVTCLDILEVKMLRVIEPKAGDTIAKFAPKLRVLVDTLRAKTEYSKIAKLPTMPSHVIIPKEFIETWWE